MRKTCRIVTRFYIDYSDTRLIFVHVRFLDPLSSYSLCRSLDSPSEEGTTLEGVGEILATEDLESPVLLDETVGEDSFVVDSGPGDDREQACGLRSRQFLWPGTV